MGEQFLTQQPRTRCCACGRISSMTTIWGTIYPIYPFVHEPRKFLLAAVALTHSLLHHCSVYCEQQTGFYQTLCSLFGTLFVTVHTSACQFTVYLLILFNWLHFFGLLLPTEN